MMTSLLICGLVTIFFVIVLTGPYFVDRRKLKKIKQDQPLAKIIPFPFPPKHPNKL